MIWETLLYLYIAIWMILAVYAVGNLALVICYITKQIINILKESTNADSKPNR